VDFATWYRSAHPGLAEAVLRAVRPPALASDALDEAFARAFAGWDRVAAMRSPAGWVYRVAVNEARRQLRRATREQVLLTMRPPPPPTPPPGGEAWLLVEDLPVRQRAAVVLRHVAGLTEAEIATALGVTRSTVSSSLAAAHRSLGARLADEAPSRGPAEVRAEVVLAVARACGPEGCDVEELGGGAAYSTTYSDAVRAAIKVRPGDLVAVEREGPAAATIVWRWWSGRVESVAGELVTVSRNVTQRSDGDARRATMDVALPEDLVGGVDVGQTVWFGTEDDRKVVVAVAGPEAEGEQALRRLLSKFDAQP
jgi:RNA polymerase sigma-70 factor (ECF subfamily)